MIIKAINVFLRLLLRLLLLLGLKLLQLPMLLLNLWIRSRRIQTALNPSNRLLLLLHTRRFERAVATITKAKAELGEEEAEEEEVRLICCLRLVRVPP
jgi:hypothetical protein